MVRFIAFCLLLFSFAPVAFAQIGDGITIRPATIEERADPGTTATYTVIVRNESEVDALYYLSKRDIVGVRDGNVPVFADPDVETTAFDMSQWISLAQDTVAVAAGQEVPIQFTITVPNDAAPGSHFAGVFVSLEPPEIRESGAAVGYEVGNIVTLLVSGDVREEAMIRQFSTSNYIYGSPNVTFNVRIENLGNTLIRPVGPLEIKNMFGQVVSEGLLFNESQAGVFPGNTREFTFDWQGEGYGFGRYEAVVSPTFGDIGARQTISSTVTFWVLPMAIIGPALLTLLVIGLLVYVTVRIYVRRQLQMYQGTRRVIVRNNTTSNSFLLVFLIMLVIAAFGFIVLLLLFS